ncbi:hypothetical protein ACFYQQ_32615 [Streptomyces sp. NPDC005496]|uniref:hypothetical protein n=1 Tax=unclassified Streptomyces TaxID=2593676 RepID=UPI00339FFE28
MAPSDAASKTRFLVLHDYGMGGVWWWVHARSEHEVLETFAGVEVVHTEATRAQAETWGLDEADVDGPTTPPGLAEARAERETQRGMPGFGALAGQHLLYLSRRWDEDDDPMVYLMEVGPDGRRLRQVELTEDGMSYRSTPEDWPFNPPLVDRYDPAWVPFVIGLEEFEAQWTRAVHDPSHWD